MPKHYTIEGGIFVDKDTGKHVLSEVYDDTMHYYIAIVKCGHVGKGKYVPKAIGIKAPNKEIAIQIALRHPRVKSMRAGSPLIDIMEVSHVEALFVGYINDCDPYYHSDRFDNYENIENRTVVMDQAIDYDNSGDKHKVPLDVVKTADKYSNFQVLQRYLAPRWIGEKLVTPKKINLRQALDEFFYYATIRLGIIKRKPIALSYYYEIYGPNNNLEIKYNDGIIGYVDNYGNHISHEVEDRRKFLDIINEKFKSTANQEQLDADAQAEQDARILAKKQSKVDKFKSRDEKHKKMMAIINKSNSSTM